METIIVAALALVGTLGGSFLANRKTTALISYRIDKLEEKVDKHNQVIDRTYQLERQAAVFTEDIKVANHRIQDLEERDRGDPE